MHPGASPAEPTPPMSSTPSPTETAEPTDHVGEGYELSLKFRPGQPITFCVHPLRDEPEAEPADDAAYPERPVKTLEDGLRKIVAHVKAHPVERVSDDEQFSEGFAQGPAQQERY